MDYSDKILKLTKDSLDILEDIEVAWTIPSKFYTDIKLFEEAKEKIFAPSWQFVGSENLVKIPGHIHPFTLMEDILNEPLVLTRDFDDKVHCLSNICTHRGNLVVESPSNEKSLRCRYHGRKFDLNGNFDHMPEFEQVKNFPSKKDDLHSLKLEKFGPLLFTSVVPRSSFLEFIEPVKSRVGWLPLNYFVLDPTRSRDYLVNANWALYCDNYLEGFHIPYVHPSLNQELDYGSYTTELFRYGNLQIGIAKGGESCFDLPDDSPDYGQEIAAYYFWLFPNLMLNFYPWGLSLNLVSPIDVGRTKISYMTYVWKPDLMDKGAGAGLDRVEREDEVIVEMVQKGVKSRFYDRGRFSPTREQGVHHFHKLIAEFMK